MLLGEKRMFELLSQLPSYSGFFECGEFIESYDDIFSYGTKNNAEFIKLIFANNIFCYFEKVEKADNIFCTYSCFVKNEGERCEYMEIKDATYYILINDVLEKIKLTIEE